MLRAKQEGEDMKKQKLSKIVDSLIGMTKEDWQNLKNYRGYTKEFQENIKDEKMRKALSNLKDVNKKEWESLKRYINHKVELLGIIKDKQLLYDTLEAFFIKVED
jgi:hypothetical protein